MTYEETQKTISDWQVATFGAVGSNYSYALRAAEEMVELMQAIERGDPAARIAEEAADVAIVLAGLGERMGRDLFAGNRAAKLRVTLPLRAAWCNERLAAGIWFMAFSFPSSGDCSHMLAQCVAGLADLCRLLGEDLRLAIDRKMRVNRARVWTLRGDGHGDHVEARDGTTDTAANHR